MEPVRILSQNKDYLIVDKPVGISIHNQEDPQNLLQLLQRQLGLQKLFPVHRLDKETSGLQALALQQDSARQLSEEFQKGNVVKVYLGILRGSSPHQQGAWKEALTDKAEGRRNPAGVAKDRMPCETRYKVLQKNKFFSFCEFHLITGRQHQIRKHTALAGHALVGDPRYGDPAYNKKISGIYQIDRLFLHCHHLKIAGAEYFSPVSTEFKKLMQEN